jgi:hypothetical protein
LKKIKSLIIIILGILLFIPIISISNAQGSYVGIQNSNKFEWGLSIYIANWNTYTIDDLENIIDKVVQLGSSNLTRIYNDWSWVGTPPQTVWSFKNTVIGVEATGLLFSPVDNTLISYTPVNGTLGWEIPLSGSDEWDDTWYIVNDTSSYLRQTLNLSRAFSPYTMLNVLFAPTTISWSTLVGNFLSVMNSWGGLYKNISSTAQINGFLINIPAFGLENNSVAIDIDVRYNSNGVLSYYKFLYGGQPLLSFILNGYVQKIPVQYIYVFIGLTAILLVEISLYIFMRKGRK